MSRFVALLPLLALVGCSSVEAEDLDGFGPIWSSLWVHEDTDGDPNYITLINVAGACGLMQDVIDAYADVEDVLEDVDDDFCEEAKEPFENWATAADKLYHEGTHVATIAVYNEDGESEPEEETYEVGDSEYALGASITYINESPYAAYLEDWDEDEDPEDGCGIDADEELDQDYWIADEGTEFEVTSLSDESSLAGTLEGSLLDDEGDDAGDVTISVSATYCELDR